MRKSLLGGAVVLVLGLTASAGCAGSSGSAGSGKPLVVGVSLSLDGELSGEGKALPQG